MSPRSGAAGPEEALVALAEAQPERTTPRCRHFGECGGCQLQHLPAEAQVTAKSAMVVQILQASGVVDVPVPQVHAAEPWEYRNRVRMRVEAGEIGYSRRASHSSLPITECPILHPVLWDAANTLRGLVRDGQSRWPSATRALELFSDAKGASLQLSLQLDSTVTGLDRDAPAQFRALAAALHARVPQLAGAGLSVTANPDPSQSRRVQESARVEIARWGEPGLLYRVGETDYRVSRNAFFQVNRFLTGTMRELVTAGRSGDLAWDLYAGAGLFSAPLARQFRQTVSVEVGEPAATDLQLQLQPFGPEHRAVRSTTLGFLRKQTAKPDLVVLDPPRAGLGPEATRALAAVRAQQIVYVSCDAGTFARDSRTLVQSGYTLAFLHLLDLFPQTFHTETVAVFRR